MISTRMRGLTRLVAVDLLDGRTPMSHEFLVENAVTFDECQGLSNTLAAIILGTLGAPARDRDPIIMRGIALAAGCPDEVADYAANSSRMERLTGDIAAWPDKSPHDAAATVRAKVERK
jgi:hypothetical protein